MSIFLDCGFHIGEGLTEFVQKGIITEDTIVFSFEPNPACNIQKRINKFDLISIDNIKAFEKAIWIKDGHIKFYQENHKISNTNSPTDGISDIDGWGSSVKKIKFQHKGYSKPIKVECIDFSKFLAKLPHDYVVCKMDIEGSEYKVLRHLIRKKTISIINELYVEFHERFMINESNDSEKRLIREIESFGVKVHLWK